MQKMKKVALLFLLLLFSFLVTLKAQAYFTDNSIAKIGLASSSHNIDSSLINKVIDDNLSFSVSQYTYMIHEIGEDSNLMPRSIKPDGSISMVSIKDWCSGFFPGSLWYLYEFSKDDYMLKQAKNFTEKLESIQYVKNNHDVGFMVFCSYGNGYRLTKDESYKKIILNTADSLSTRFNPTVGCIRSWDWGKWKFPVIIDNMMNLELLFWASENGGNLNHKNIAVNHANTTIKNHFRENFSTFHLVDYDPKTGTVLKKQTVQGYSDDSSWARGQSWGLYGYTMSYRMTKNKLYLEQATKIANYLLNHPNMPDDLIPYWDYDAPNIPNEYRDTSAAAILASALYELSSYTSPETSEYYLNVADKILLNLSSDVYRAQFVGDNKGFILKHGVGNIPEGTEIDVPLNYGDYYFIEANMRRLMMSSTSIDGEYR